MMLDSVLAPIAIWVLSCGITYLLGYRFGSRKTYENLAKIVEEGLIKHHKNAQG